MRAPTPDDIRRQLPPVWVIYDHPADFPEHFVVRKWYGLQPEDFALGFRSVAEARCYIEAAGGCFCMPRSAREDAVILESWI
jgi:hypothetical protein